MAQNHNQLAREPIRYIPVAEYLYGLYRYGAKTAHELVFVKADSKAEAHRLAYDSLKPSTTESVRYIETRPNPEHVGYKPYHSLDIVQMDCVCAL